MYQNVRETQLELRERRPSEAAKSTLAQKNSSSSGSDIHETLRIPREERHPSKGKLGPEASISAEVSANDSQTTASTLKGITASRTQSFAQRFKSTSKPRGNVFWGTDLSNMCTE
jgi:hypothetical protein